MKKIQTSVYEIITGILAVIAVSFAFIDISKGLNNWQKIIDNVIYCFFVVDYVFRLVKSDNKKDFVKKNIFDLIAIIPFSTLFMAFRFVRFGRFVRLVKLFKLSRLIAYSLRLIRKTKTFLNTNGFKYMLCLCCMLIFVGGISIHFAEGMSVEDGLWWAFVTATTVGYGDLSPSSGIGRAIAIILMMSGIGLIGTLTSTITSFFLNREKENDIKKNEVISLIIHQLEDFDNMSDEDIDRACAILQTLKKE